MLSLQTMIKFLYKVSIIKNLAKEEKYYNNQILLGKNYL